MAKNRPHDASDTLPPSSSYFLSQDRVRGAVAEWIYGGIEKWCQEIDKGIPIEVPQVYQLLTLPPNPGMGHLAFPCFTLARGLRLAPPKIAVELEHKLKTHPLVKNFSAQGPYLNLNLNMEQVGRKVLEAMISGEYFEQVLTQSAPKTMIEYSQPNTHKEIHVGHMRNLSLGHALVLLHKYCGVEVISSTFPGDMGTHVAKCLWFLKYRCQERPPSERRGAWLGKIYTLAHNTLEEESKNPERDGENRAQLSEILTQLEREKSGEFYQLWRDTRQWSLDLMNKIYRWAGVEFDHWYFESEVDRDSLELAKQYLAQGHFVQSQGAVGMDLSEDNLGFALMIKSDGNGLYATKDIELARRKFTDYKIEKSLYVVDVRQTRHFAQVFKILEKVGWPRAKNCVHLAYDMVELPDGAMSSRKGNIVPIEELIEKMVNQVKVEHLNKYRDQWSAEKIETTAHQIALGAIKYGMLKMDPNRKIVFDMKEWLKLDGDSGPYIQYVYARIQSLLEKVKARVEQLPPFTALPWQALELAAEQNLANQLIQFNLVVSSATENHRPNQLTHYLFELCKLFNSFYAACPIGQEQDSQKMLARYGLCQATGKVVERGLNLLGITPPQQM